MHWAPMTNAVNKNNQLVLKCSTSIRDEKWHWPLFTQIIGCVYVCDECKSYSQIHEQNEKNLMILLDFKRRPLRVLKEQLEKSPGESQLLLKPPPSKTISDCTREAVEFSHS